MSAILSFLLLHLIDKYHFVILRIRTPSPLVQVSTVYNQAIATSNTDVIANSVIVVFVMDLDEWIFAREVDHMQMHLNLWFRISEKWGAIGELKEEDEIVSQQEKHCVMLSVIAS